MNAKSYAMRVLTLGSVLFLTNCSSSGTPIKEQLASVHFFGEHPVSRIDSLTTFSDMKLLVYWQASSDTIVITPIPISKIVIVRDNTTPSTAIEFILDNDWLEGAGTLSPSEKLNYNEFLVGDTLLIARIHIAIQTPSPAPTPTQVRLISP